MKESPSFVGIAALLGDQARATIMAALMSGQALTASELALEAGITKQTASSHLNKLVDGGLLTVEVQGRHRYFQLAAPDVAVLLENLMGIARRTAPRVRFGPREPALQKARVCYDHLAGELAVIAFESFLQNGLIRSTVEQSQRVLQVTPKGAEFFAAIGIDIFLLKKARRPVCRDCLDWSMRRHHLSGSLGKSLLEHCFASSWAKKKAGTRIVLFSGRGERAFRRAFHS